MCVDGSTFLYLPKRDLVRVHFRPVPTKPKEDIWTSHHPRLPEMKPIVALYVSAGSDTKAPVYLLNERIRPICGEKIEAP